ncbi:hypothetical protein [Kocuria nitroreducens]|uniref:hypothetical protein n=1 Tax=Kocuria nitroreducens TaxID=3058914 RepID=UPI0036D91DA3
MVALRQHVQLGGGLHPVAKPGHGPGFRPAGAQEQELGGRPGVRGERFGPDQAR